MEELKHFHAYRQKKDGSYFHVTTILAKSLKEAIVFVRDNHQYEYRVLGTEIDTGMPYDDKDFPCHIYKRIENVCNSKNNKCGD